MRSLSSKLKYNVRILDRRVRDVEASVDHFDRKLEDVRKKLLEQNNSKDISMALESPCDKFEFDSFMDSIVQSQQTKYEGLCFKILDKKSLRKLKRNSGNGAPGHSIPSYTKIGPIRRKIHYESFLISLLLLQIY